MAELSGSARPFAVATVVRTQGSTPQTVGAKLVVSDREAERPTGTLGGGCVEADAILACRDILAGGPRSLRGYSLAEDLAWNTGLVCGGTMWILAEAGEDAVTIGGNNYLTDFVHATADGPPLAVATLMERHGRELAYSGRLVVGTDGRATGSIDEPARVSVVASEALRQIPHGTPRVLPLDEAHELLIEPITGKPRLVIAGGGHVAQAIARQALLLDFDVTILEDRPEFADPARFGGARVIGGFIPDTLASLDYGWSSHIVVATRGHKLDGDCILAAVKTKARYIGLLGSRRKAVLIAEMLRENGVPEERIAAIRTPVGLDLGGRTPAEIALSVMAQITSERYGRQS
jgi:xanthine dehydrogenase accessory factor